MITVSDARLLAPRLRKTPKLWSRSHAPEPAHASRVKRGVALVPQTLDSRAQMPRTTADFRHVLKSTLSVTVLLAEAGLFDATKREFVLGSLNRIHSGVACLYLSDRRCGPAPAGETRTLDRSIRSARSVRCVPPLLLPGCLWPGVGLGLRAALGIGTRIAPRATSTTASTLARNPRRQSLPGMSTHRRPLVTPET
jgi:hypothetical protein